MRPKTMNHISLARGLRAFHSFAIIFKSVFAQRHNYHIHFPLCAELFRRHLTISVASSSFSFTYNEFIATSEMNFGHTKVFIVHTN